MTRVKRIGRGAALGAAILLGLGLGVSPAQAAYVITFDQVGSNVVATGSGSLDLTGLNLVGIGASPAFMSPSYADIIVGPARLTLANTYRGIAGPASFGLWAPKSASSGSGDLVGMVASELWVPYGYVSGTALSDSMTFDGASFASLGLTPGSYEWTWGGSGLDADSFTIDVGTPAAVPEPSSLLLMLLPLGLGLGLTARRRRTARGV